jgi:acylphosphatase
MYDKIGYVVSGRVQGVCFRAYTQQAAQELDITGWVKNRADGRVEGEAFGAPEAMESFIQWLHKGSPHGHVDRVNVDRLDSETSRPPSFEVRY